MAHSVEQRLTVMCNAAIGSLEVTHRQDAHIAAEEAEVCRALEGTIGAMVPPQPRLPDTHLADAQQSVESHGPDSIARHSQRIAIAQVPQSLISKLIPVQIVRE